MLKPVLAAPPPSAKKVRAQLQQLSPEVASHARAVAERAVEHVHTLLATRQAGGSVCTRQMSPNVLGSPDIRGSLNQDSGGLPAVAGVARQGVHAMSATGVRGDGTHCVAVGSSGEQGPTCGDMSLAVDQQHCAKGNLEQVTLCPTSRAKLCSSKDTRASSVMTPSVGCSEAEVVFLPLQGEADTVTCHTIVGSLSRNHIDRHIGDRSTCEKPAGKKKLQVPGVYAPEHANCLEM